MLVDLNLAKKNPAELGIPKTVTSVPRPCPSYHLERDRARDEEKDYGRINQEAAILDFFMGTGFTLTGFYVMFDGYTAFVSPALITVEKSVNPVSPRCSSAFPRLARDHSGAYWIARVRQPFSKGRASDPGNDRKHSFLRASSPWPAFGVYFFIFWGRIPMSFPLSFSLRNDVFIQGGAWWKIFLISGITVAVIWYLFGVLAMIPSRESEGKEWPWF